MTRRFEEFDVQRADLDAVTILRRDVLVLHRREMRDVDLRAGPLGQFAKAGGEIGVRVAIENGGDAQSFALRFGDVIIDIAFRIDHGGLAVRTDEIRSVSKSFDKETFEIHRWVQISFGSIMRPHLSTHKAMIACIITRVPWSRFSVFAKSQPLLINLRASKAVSVIGFCASRL